MNMERTPLFLMANLGAEVARMVRASERGDAGHLDQAYRRALGILRNIHDHRDMQSRLSEIAMLEEVLSRLKTDADPTFRKNIQAYFTPFSMRFVREQMAVLA
jgi:hypothetical protein